MDNEQKPNVKELKRDLAAVLRKHNVYIAFTCADGSDTHGLSNAYIAICARSGDRELVRAGWTLSAYDLER